MNDEPSPLQSQRIEELERHVAEQNAEHAALLERMHELEGLHDDRQAEAEALRRVGEAVGALFDLEEMLRVVTGIAIHVTSTESSQVYLLNDSREELVLRAVDSESPNDMVGKVRLKLGEGLAGWVALTKEAALITRDAYPTTRGSSTSQSFGKSTTKACCRCP